MDKTLEKAVNILKNGSYTCVLCKGDDIFTSEQRGIKPLVSYHASCHDFSGFSAADKVVGRGAAFLYILLGISALYAEVISQSALELLERNKIFVGYGSVVENIINRSGNGICPFEEAVIDIDDKDEAYAVICEKMKKMKIF